MAITIMYQDQLDTLTGPQMTYNQSTPDNTQHTGDRCLTAGAGLPASCYNRKARNLYWRKYVVRAPRDSGSITTSAINGCPHPQLQQTMDASTRVKAARS